MTKLLSVIIPVFNGSKWLKEAIVSTSRALRGIDAEIVVIDDGSTDASRHIVSSLATGTHGVSIVSIRNEMNRGIVYSLNRGLDEARGLYIARMDADDVCMPERFSRQLAFLDEHRLDACGSWFIEIGRGIPRVVRWPHLEAELRAAMLFQNTICHPTLMARREVFEQFRYRETYNLAEDYDLFARALGRFRIANVPQPLIKYRRHSKQTTVTRRAEMERVTGRIRIAALSAVGIGSTTEQQRIHNLIRAPQSIRSEADLAGIEMWIMNLRDQFSEPAAQRTIALQWVRACIRAAPLGKMMWECFRSSPLCEASGAGYLTYLDLKILSMARIDYASPLFSTLRRLGLSA